MEDRRNTPNIDFPYEGINFTFKDWNLVEAYNSIDYFLEMKSVLTVEQRSFLLQEKENINSIMQHILSELKIDISADLKTTYNIQEIINLYQSKMEHVQDFLKQNISDLMNKVHLELSRIYKNYANENYYYELLLTNLQKCYLGVYNKIVRSYSVETATDNDTDNKIEKLPIQNAATETNLDKASDDKEIKAKTKLLFQPIIFKSLSSIFDIADKLGSVSMPVSQMIDPLLGSSYKGDDRFLDHPGVCLGMIKYWSNGIAQQKIVDASAMIMNKFVYNYQEKSKNHYPVVRTPDFANLDNAINSIVDSLTDEFIYGFRVGLKNQNILKSGEGHMLGIRKIPSTNEYELLDPNYGLFTFNNEDSLKDFLKILITNYYFIGYDFQNGKLLKLDKQPSETRTSIMDASQFYRKVNPGLSLEDKLKIIYLFEQIDKRVTSDNKKLNMGDRFMCILPIIFKNITSTDELKVLKERILSLNFIDSVKISSGFFSRSTTLRDKILTFIQQKETELAVQAKTPQQIR